MMKRNACKALIPLLLALTLLLSACAGSAQKSEKSYSAPVGNSSAAADYAYDAMPAAMEEPSSPAQNASTQTVPADLAQSDADVRKIIYNAYMYVTADDPAAALDALIEKAKALGGYVAGSYTTNDELGAYRCTASLKVPADQLEALVTAAREAGRVDSYQLSSDDISQSYYDIAARLKSAKAEEAQLISILDDCKTVEEVLAVRESLAAVRSNIESYQGQINLWDNLVSYATLELSVHRTQRAAVEGEGEPIAIWKASDVWKKMRLGFTNSARFVVNAIGAIGIFLAYAILPIAVVAAIVFGIAVLMKKLKPMRDLNREKRRLKREARREKRLAKQKKE